MRYGFYSLIFNSSESSFEGCFMSGVKIFSEWLNFFRKKEKKNKVQKGIYMWQASPVLSIMQLWLKSVSNLWETRNVFSVSSCFMFFIFECELSVPVYWFVVCW